MAQKQKCFIIAPISTLEERAPLYLNDVAHCEHVIDHLLAPAVERAGFEPVKPRAKGANLIHAEIVGNLQTAALVLCDMSGLNPNVFFELGVRTAMNKAICLVIDEATKNPPFDLNAVNHHAYVSDLRPWVLPGEIEKLARHISESAAEKENALWKYFSLRIAAEPADSKPNEANELSLLRTEVEALRKDLRSVNRAPASLLPSQETLGAAWDAVHERDLYPKTAAVRKIADIAKGIGVVLFAIDIQGNNAKVLIPAGTDPALVPGFKGMVLGALGLTLDVSYVGSLPADRRPAIAKRPEKDA